MNRILGFKGPYRFLSNFWPAKVELDGLEYQTTEHAYQAAKTLDVAERKEIRESAKPGDAKKLGKKLTMRPDWEQVKFQVMENVVRQKFTKYKDLKEMLLSTGDDYLEETNNWQDVYWGVCNGKGQNKLGKILMKVRDEIRASETLS